MINLLIQLCIVLAVIAVVIGVLFLLIEYNKNAVTQYIIQVQTNKFKKAVLTVFLTGCVAACVGLALAALLIGH